MTQTTENSLLFYFQRLGFSKRSLKGVKGVLYQIKLLLPYSTMSATQSLVKLLTFEQTMLLLL